jgi:threonine aldolase
MSAPIVDLRSDTVTRPTEAMRRAMAAAEVGDDVFGDDPTVNRLQDRAAEIFGFEASLFFPTGTQSNLAALMSHCQRGEEVLVGMEAHTYRYEAGGGAVLGSIQPQAIVNRPDGTLDPKDIDAAVKPDDPHFAKTRLLALENTITGRVIPRAYFDEALALAKRRGLATHLDGARIFNASVKLGMPVNDLCRGFDSVSSCLSKGLGAPAGTMLLGSKDLTTRAKRARKMLGGVMRQAGVLAAAGLYALENNVARLAEDHANAERLAQGIGAPAPSSNMVFFDSKPGLPEHLAKQGVVVLPGAKLRLVTHLDVDAAGIDRAIAAFNSFK